MRLRGSLPLSLLLASAIALAGCEGGPTESRGYELGMAGYVAVTPTAKGLVLSNQTEQLVYSIAFESELTTRIDWVAGVSGPSLVPGEQRVFDWSKIPGYATDKDGYVVYWWHAEALPDGSKRAGTINHISVKI